MGQRNSTYIKTLAFVGSAVFLLTVLLYSNASSSRIPAVPFLSAITDAYATPPPQVEQYFPPPDPIRKDYREWNGQSLRELHTCMALGNCGSNQRKVALLAAHWFEEAVVRDWRGGEGVWGMSVYKNLRSLGYTTLFANSFEEALYQYRMFPELVKVVIRNKAGECHQDPKCVKGHTNPTGIPAWKIFDFEFFASRGGHFHASLMKGQWILSANPDDNNHDTPSPIQYIGYSIEEECKKIAVIPLAERSNQVWMLMKEIVYVYDNKFAWDRSYFHRAAEELNLNFVGGWKLNQHYGWDPDTQGEMKDIEDRAHGVINFGKLNQTEFTNQVGTSKVMIGQGNPWWSPSPYNALCQGVPFIHPILHWDKNDPWNKASWYSTQHPSLSRFGPPYVYNVHARNWTGFLDAIEAASTTEIGSHCARFIPEHMTEAAVRERLTNLMETDWKTRAADLLKERLQELEEGRDAYVSVEMTILLASRLILSQVFDL
ncbi:hypothetical protein B0H34DRAFT_750525 [Crassisporium funariophilum]|nr:hypothetical protein B0H34DRAFT_750525 [Crassisporium funariophilum]